MEGRTGINASIFLDKNVILFVYDKDKVQRRDGILKGFDETHYYVELTFGNLKGSLTSFLKTDVKRITLSNSKGGVSNR